MSSFSPLITLHVALGELVALAVLWMGVELLDTPTQTRITRALAAAVVLVIASWLSYFVGGYYYVNSYGPVKAVITKGPWSWAHKIFMETKEHIFLAGPYIATAAAAMIYAFKRELAEDPVVRRTFLICFAVIFVGVALVVGLGVMVSAGYRVGLAGG